MNDERPDPAASSPMRPAMWRELAELPSRFEWLDLRRRFVEATVESFATWISPDQPHFHEQLRFAIGRFDAGASLVHRFGLGKGLARGRILDLGSGNGGLAFAFANCREYTVHTIDVVPNAVFRSLRKALPLPVHSAVGDGAALPFADGSFQFVILFDVFEHLAAPGAVGREVMRVLRPGGTCLVTTPARAKFLLARDPHYGIRGLLMLPNAVQRFVVNRLFRRRVLGLDGVAYPAYDVEHTYWHVGGIGRCFPGGTIDVLYEREFRPPGQFSREWVRHPGLILEQLRYELRHLLFEHVLIHKGAPAPGAERFDRYTERP